MKKYIYLVLLIFSVVLTGCPDDIEPELVFEEVENTAPENIRFSFDTPDPQCLPTRFGFIYANESGGKITIKCTNASTVLLAVEGIDRNENYYRCERGHWSVKVVGNNTLVFDIESIDAAGDPASEYLSDFLPVSGTVKGDAADSEIHVTRYIQKRVNKWEIAF